MLNEFVNRGFILTARIFLLLVICCGCAAQQDHNAQSVEQVINDYIVGEFELAQDKRAQYCAFKRGESLKLGSEFTPDSADPIVYIFPEGDNLVVVKTYKISTVTVHADHAEAIVNFETMFASKGEGEPRSFEKSMKQETVTYQLVMLNNKWKIIDPPLPRVSYDRFISFLLNQINITQKIINSGKASNSQKELLGKQKADYGILKNI